MWWIWIRNQYNDLKGNIKYGILYWLLLGGGMTWLAHWLQAVFRYNIAGWLALAAPIFSTLAVLYLLLIVPPRMAANAAEKVLPLSLSQDVLLSSTGLVDD